MAIQDAPWHFGRRYANSINDWMPTDTEDLYLELMQDPEHREYFAALGWDQPGAITYKINRHGFRCKEFDGSPSIMTLGCSFTTGIGLPIDVIWPERLGKEFGLQVANISWGGISSDTCFRLAEYWLPQIKPKIVAMLSPPATRFELLLESDKNDSKAEVFMPRTNSSIMGSDNLFLKHWYLNDDNSRLNHLRNCLAIQQLCHQHNIPFLIEHADEHCCASREEVGYARDYMHGGPELHKRIAEKMINDYQART